jgi:tellurite resistance protein
VTSGTGALAGTQAATAGRRSLMKTVPCSVVPVLAAAGPTGKISFTPGFWSFSFSYAAAVSDALVWLAITKPPAATGYAIAAIALLTAFVAWIAYRTVLLAVRRQLFPLGRMAEPAA